jgi:ABC-type uncharacterized transport system ATPase subunit
VLTPQETTDLFTAIRGLRDAGMTVLFISHKLKEVREISDRVTVMRAGSVIGTVRTEEATPAQLASMMVGREMSLDVPKPPARPGANVLRVRGLSGPAVHGVSLDIAAGEIVGLAGVEGNGQTELVELLAGLRRPTAGTVTVDDTDVTHLDAAGHRRAGIAHVPEDRLTNGAALDRSIADNLIVDRHDRPPVARRGILRTRAYENSPRTSSAGTRSAPRTPTRRPAPCPAATCRRSSSPANCPPGHACCSPRS